MSEETFSQYPHLRNSAVLQLADHGLAGLRAVIDTRNEHIYLFDHVFGRDCFVPATMIMELFAEAAAWFMRFYCQVAGQKVIRLEELSIKRALAIRPGASLEARILLTGVEGTGGAHRLKLEIVSQRVNNNGESLGDRLNAQCCVVMASAAPEAERLEIPELDYDYYQFSPEILYRNFFPSLGPLFQSQTGKFAVSKSRDVLIGEYNCFDKERRFIKQLESDFFLSPLGYDCCLQYTVFLSRIISIVGRLPIGCQALHIYNDHPHVGNCKVVVRCLEKNDEVMQADFWAFDARRALIVSAEKCLVQYAPISQASFTYRNREAFDELLAQHRVERLDW